MRLSDLVPGESGCPRLAYKREPWRVRALPFRRKRWFSRNPPTMCGLLWRHDGPCEPFVPGEYLPPPLLHPLDAFKAAHARCCPLCGGKSTPPVAEAVTAFRGEHANWDRPSVEWQWEFWPCGCVVRTVSGGHGEAPARQAGA